MNIGVRVPKVGQMAHEHARFEALDEEALRIDEDSPLLHLGGRLERSIARPTRIQVQHKERAGLAVRVGSLKSVRPVGAVECEGEDDWLRPLFFMR